MLHRRLARPPTVPLPLSVCLCVPGVVCGCGDLRDGQYPGLRVLRLRATEHARRTRT